MNLRLLVIFLFFVKITSAQIFSPYPYQLPFLDIESGVNAFADVDGDGDADVLIGGRLNPSVIGTRLYINDGQSNFTELENAPIENLELTSASFRDIDGDDDQDLIISGRDDLEVGITKLYINDGQGNFEEVINTPFGNFNGTTKFADVDGDNDQDVMISGLGTFEITRLYLNDGVGNFSSSSSGFTGLKNSSIVFSDVDGDDDQDVIISGEQGSGSSSVQVTKLYINNGFGNFSNTNTPFVDVTRGSIAFSDIDADNDKDVLITGRNGHSINATEESKLYLNDGQGNFTEIIDQPFDGVENSSVTFVDVDGDNDQDVMISGDNNGGGKSRLYLNDGEGNFKKANPFENSNGGMTAFADIDGDNDEDLFITGRYSDLYTGTIFELRTHLYLNDGQGNFTEIMNIPFDPVFLGTISFEDFDGDNDLDLLLTGSNNSSEKTAKLYLNDGQGNFTEMVNTPFEGVVSGSVAISDIDSDGDKDILITGRNSSNNSTSNLYINNGQGNFTLNDETPFSPTVYRKSFFVDLDGDNDMDVYTGFNFFLNDGLGNFIKVISNQLYSENFNSFTFGDADGDNDQDVIVLLGDNPTYGCKLFLNDGQGEFTPLENNPFENLYLVSSVHFFDMDGDDDQDLIISARDSLSSKRTRIYLNDGQATFTELASPDFKDLSGSFVFSDVNGDNDIDIFLAGNHNNNSSRVANLYLNRISNNIADISGFCFYDSNQNQIKDANERSLFNQVIQLNPDHLNSYPDENGQYRFYTALNEEEFEISAIPHENWRLTTDTTIYIDLQGQSLSNVNFGFIPNSLISLIEPDISSAPTRCSFDVPFWLRYQNKGTTFENGYLEFSIDEGVSLVSATIIPDEIIGNKLRWNYNNISPSQVEKIRLIFSMPDASNIGDTLNFTASTYLINNDQDTIQNTVYNYNPVLNCAYDPNDKAVIPVGVGNDQLTLFDTELEYKIRFQNTGTDTAFTVRIEDDLDSELDWNTFRPVSASHPYEVDMDVESGRVTFLFRNILLPDSTTNEVLSHGFVKYKIFPLSNLPEGTPITNEASIFFDFNEPIITNTTLNRLVSDLTNTEEISFSTELTVIPNPFQKNTIFRIEDIPGNRGTLNIFDTNGVLVFSETVTSNTDFTFRKEGLASGIYFYEVVDQKSERVFRGKVIKY